MIQEDYSAYVAALVSQELLSGKLGQAQHALNALLARNREPRCLRRRIVRSPRRSEQCSRRGKGPPRPEGRTQRWRLLVAHKAVVHVCIVNVPSSGRPIRIDIPREGTLVESRTGVRRIESCNRAMLIQQEAVIHKVCVNEDSQDASIRGKAAAIRTLEWARALARQIECGDDAFLSRRKPWTA